MAELLAGLAGTGPATFLRISWWGYPLVNVAHVLGLATLFGAILVHDVRLLRGTPGDPTAVAAAVAGLTVAGVSGFLLFAVRAPEYAAMPMFWLKIAAVAVAVGNAVVARASGLVHRRPRMVAAVSLLGWTAAVVAGRLIGYSA
jgi:hypothetical protein